MRRDRAHRGFTLIELLVVLAIITLLISILAPALSQVRTVAKQLREVAQGSQQNLAFHSYATDMNDRLMPGYLVWDWAHPRPDAMMPPGHEGRLLEGSAVKPYPLRLAPWFDYDFRGLVGDQYDEIAQLPFQEELGGNVANNTISPYGGSREWAISQTPTFGMNSTFIGGDWGRGAFRPTNLRNYGKFYVADLSDARNPSRLISFASAREPTTVNPSPGYYRLEAPFTARNPAFGWLPSDTSTTFGAPVRGFFETAYDETKPSSHYGNVSFRWLDKAVVAHLDGHVENLGLSEMKDMRRWYDNARHEQDFPGRR